MTAELKRALDTINKPNFGVTKSPDPFMEGIAIACADLVRLFDQPAMAAGIIAGHGFTLADFKGCDPYDLKVIRKLYRTESELCDNRIGDK